MLKLAEFEQMTRKLQRLLGLTDPTSETFSRMFGLLPYPHTKSIEVRFFIDLFLLLVCGKSCKDTLVSQ